MDVIPQDVDGFYSFKDRYYKAMDGAVTGDIVVDSLLSYWREKNLKQVGLTRF